MGSVCINAEGDADMHEDGLATCDICGATSCAPCREAVRGSKSRCLQCNEILPDMGVKGSCGIGGCQ